MTGTFGVTAHDLAAQFSYDQQMRNRQMETPVMYHPEKMTNPQHDIHAYWPRSRTTAADVQDEFDAMPTNHRHAAHALLHMQASLGHIAGLLAALDHQVMPSEYPDGDPTVSERRSGLARHLANTVICAAKIANEMGIDLSVAVPYQISKIKTKFPVRR